MALSYRQKEWAVEKKVKVNTNTISKYGSAGFFITKNTKNKSEEEEEEDCCL